MIAPLWKSLPSLNDQTIAFSRQPSRIARKDFLPCHGKPQAAAIDEDRSCIAVQVANFGLRNKSQLTKQQAASNVLCVAVANIDLAFINRMSPRPTGWPARNEPSNCGTRTTTTSHNSESFAQLRAVKLTSRASSPVWSLIPARHEVRARRVPPFS